MPRIILHIDFDYFYAQVEEVIHPEYRGKPLVVCMYSGRSETSGAVATCNYIARKYGVRAGIPIIRAKKLLEHIDSVFLAANHQLYAEKSYHAMSILETYCDTFEAASIDEAFLDLSKQYTDLNYAKERAEEIKKHIFNELHLTSSVGIGPNKLIAKMASDIEKPNGLTVITQEMVHSFLAPLSVDKIPGIGPKTKELLNSQGIETVGDIEQADPTKIMELFGKKSGTFILHAAQGIDESPVEARREQKQMSRIMTLKRNSRDFDDFKLDVDVLITDIVHELQDQQLLCESVGIIVIDESMQTISRSQVLSHPVNNIDEIRSVVYALYHALIQDTSQEFRRIGVKAERLQNMVGQKKLGDF